MANPNLANTKSIHGKTWIANVTATKSTIFLNNTSANTVYKIENINAIADGNAIIHVEMYDFTSNQAANVAFRQLVSSNTYTPLSTRNNYFYLKEGDSLSAYANANCNVIIVYEILSSENSVLDRQSNTYSFPNIVSSSGIWENSDTFLFGGPGNLFVNSFGNRPNVLYKVNNLTLRNLGTISYDLILNYYSKVSNTTTTIYSNTIQSNSIIQLIDQDKYLYIPQGDSLSYIYPDVTESEFANVVLLLKGDGTEGSAAIIDSSSYNKTITVPGAGTRANISASIRKYGTGSIRIQRSDGYANIFNASSLTIPAAASGGAFTLEAWVYLTGSGRHCILGDPYGYAYSTSWGCGIWDTNGPYGGDSVTKGLCWILSPINGYGGNMVYSGQYPTLNQWTHIAIVRNAAGLWSFFMDGVKGTTYNTNAETHPFSQFPTNNGPTGAMTIPTRIGEFNGVITGGNSASMPAGFNGYIDEFRITIGSARYNNNFTPPQTTFASSFVLSSTNTVSGTIQYNTILE